MTWTDTRTFASLGLSFGEILAVREDYPNGMMTTGGIEMLDAIFVGLVVAFFALALWYVRFCERV
jgi:hypothetical protein